MLKMTCSSKYHCKFILVTIVDAQLVFYRSSWLNNIIPAFAIATQSGKGKKASLAMTVRLNQNQRFCFSIAWSKASTLKFDQFRKILVPFFAKRSLDFVFTNFRGKYQILNFLFCRTRYSNGLQIFIVSDIISFSWKSV
jgi:hypothetical protein